MRVLYSGTLAASAGGPAMSVYNSLWGLRQLGVQAELIQFPLHHGDVMRGTDVPIHYVHSHPISPLAYARSYKKDVEACGMFDIYHAQGVWQWSTYAMADVARNQRKPYLITPRGMLYPQDIAKSNAFFKRVSLRWRLLDDLNKAACVHVTCEEEMLHCRNLGVVSPIAIIPNPTSISEHKNSKTDDVFRVGYLGRLSPRKNVESLIYAFADLGAVARDAELLIIGGGDKRYEQFLRNEVSRLSLDNVRFAGFLNGEEKDKALASCSILVMPSEFENFGNVVLEGLIRRIPCIATTGAPWSDLNTHKCGWQVPYSQQDITAAIQTAINTSREELAQMGERGYELARSKYSIEAVAHSLKNVYEWVLGAECPENVYLL